MIDDSPLTASTLTLEAESLDSRLTTSDDSLLTALTFAHKDEFPFTRATTVANRLSLGMSPLAPQLPRMGYLLERVDELKNCLRWTQVVYELFGHLAKVTADEL